MLTANPLKTLPVKLAGQGAFRSATRGVAHRLFFTHTHRKQKLGLGESETIPCIDWAIYDL